MSKKVLFCASTVSHILNFHLPYLQSFKAAGYEVHVLVNESAQIPWADQVHIIPFQKQLLSPINIKAIFQARVLLRKERFDVISTNTTLAGLIVRAAVRLMGKKRPQVCHLVHGYLFGYSDGWKKWIYLMPELIVAPITDKLLVMNHEDQEIAQKYHLYRKKLYYVHGMGVDPERGKIVDRQKKIEMRTLRGYRQDQFLFVYLAEFSKRKNQSELIQAFSLLNRENVLLLLGGEGKTKETCQQLVHKLHLEEKIHFLGYVTDVTSLYQICDCVVSSSKIEGLPFHIMEAEGCGLPIIASDIKGHRELVREGYNGYLYQDKMELTQKMEMVAGLPEQILWKMGMRSKEQVSSCTLDQVKGKILDFYALPRSQNDIFSS